MPGGIDHPVAGYLGFCAVKFVGYSLFAGELTRRYRSREGFLSVAGYSLLAGATRTLIGMTAGAAYSGLWWLVAKGGVGDAAFVAGAGFLLGLIPVRVAEWKFLLYLFFRSEPRQRERDRNMIALGTGYSYVLDVPALIGYVVTGGFWIC